MAAGGGTNACFSFPDATEFCSRSETRGNQRKDGALTEFVVIGTVRYAAATSNLTAVLSPGTVTGEAAGPGATCGTVRILTLPLLQEELDSRKGPVNRVNNVT